MKKFNKILCLLLALAMMLSLVACGGGNEPAETTAAPADTTGASNEAVEYVDPYADLADDYDALSEAIYNDVLGEFYEVYQASKEATNVSERQALMAVAEAKLMEAAMMVPLTTSGGRFA